MRRFALLAMFILSLPGCKTDTPEDFFTDQKILFHYSYENWAWGDWSFDLPASTTSELVEWHDSLYAEIMI